MVAVFASVTLFCILFTAFFAQQGENVPAFFAPFLQNLSYLKKIFLYINNINNIILQALANHTPPPPIFINPQPVL
jgi:hypothetical protein